MNKLLEVIYEDPHFIGLNKPPRTHSVMQEGSELNSVAYALCDYLPGAATIADKAEDSGLVQRLDFETSGVLIAARSREAWRALSELGTEGGMRKRYFAVVEGRFPDEQHLHTWLGNPNRRAKKVRIYPEEPSKRSRALSAETTIWRRSYSEANDLSIIEVELLQGRRHQIRAHTSYLGHPILGDSLYGSTRALDTLNDGQPLSPGSPSFFLHARKVSFVHPFGGDNITIKAPFPRWLLELESPDMKLLAELLRK